ncbi:MAG: hypothetical protein ACR2QT_05405 [Woeseiaceae bacterium]
MKKSLFKLSLIAIAAISLPFAVFAQDEEAEAPGDLTDIWMVVVKPGMEAEFDEAMGAHLQFRADAGESRSWDSYRVAVGHDIRPIGIRSCCFDWADLDTYREEDNEKGLGENFNENVHQYVDHYHHYLEEVDWENSHWPEGSNGPYFGVTTWYLKEGRGPESSQAMEKMSQLAKNEGWSDIEGNNWLWLSRIGGQDALMIVSSYANYADMAPPEQNFYQFAVENLGEEEADQMFDDFNSGFSSSDYTIWVHDEELSTPDDGED